MHNWRAEADRHERSVREEIDAVKAVEALNEMAYYLPQPHKARLQQIIEEIKNGQHNRAVSAMLRPSTMRQARELACQPTDDTRRRGQAR